MTYRALIVDYGGVLTSSMTASFAAFCLANGVQPDRLKGVLAVAYGSTDGAEPEGLVAALETGRLPVEEFNRRLAEALSEGLVEPVEPADLASRMFGTADPDQRMMAAVRAARASGLKTGLISNTWGLHPRHEWFAEAFDVVVLSGAEGIRKPEAAIYRRAADRLGVGTDECVFVDDIPVNVEGARAVGMAGVLHRDAAITIPKLEELLGVTLGG
jgi:putative hydrolase of the HAD superfamily